MVELVNELKSARLQKRPRLRLATAVMALSIVMTCLPAAPVYAEVTCSYPANAYDSGGVPKSGFPNDPLFSKQWGLDQITAPQAWSSGVRGAGAVIAIIDSGIDLTHPDLADRRLSGKDFFEGAEGDCPGPQDDLGHGTRVAGVAAASTNNGIGIAGAAPNARIMPLKVTPPGFSPINVEGFAQAVIAAIYYAADNGADVINLSIAAPSVLWDAAFGPGTSQGLREAARYAWAQGSVVIAAAGNSYAYGTPAQVAANPLCMEPAASPPVVCVAATGRDGRPAPYSNLPVQDPAQEPGVSVRAPGGVGDECETDEAVWLTAWPGEPECAGPTPLEPYDQGPTKGYGSSTGTSFAAPFVSGVAALLAGKGLANRAIVQCLKVTSSNKGVYDPVMGYGIVDAGAAVARCVN